MAVDVKKYYEELMTEAGLSDDKVKEAVSTFFSNDKVSKRLSDDLLRQQDYSRNMDKLRTDNQKAADYYQTLVTWEQQRKADWDAQFAALQNNNGNGNNGNGVDLDKRFKEIEDKYSGIMKQQEAAFISVAKKMGKLASQHAVEFREALDTDALEKIAIEQKLDLDHAYNALVADRRKAQGDEARKAEIERAKQDAVREFASSHQIPIDSTPRESGFGKPSFSGESKAVQGYVPNSGRLDNAQTGSLRAGFAEEWENWERSKGAAT